MGPVVNFVDSARPLVSALGPRQPAVRLLVAATRHPAHPGRSTVGGEDRARQPQDADREGAGRRRHLRRLRQRLSRQDIDWTPAGDHGHRHQRPGRPVRDPDRGRRRRRPRSSSHRRDGSCRRHRPPPTCPGPLWAAAGAVFTATTGQGRVICVAAPNMLGLIGPLFPPGQPAERPVAPGSTPAASAPARWARSAGSRSTCPSQITAGTMLVLSTAAAEVYEDRGGPLQVVEPSRARLQVAYYGYFTPLVMSAAGIIKVVILMGEQCGRPRTSRRSGSTRPGWKATAAPPASAAADAGRRRRGGTHGLDEMSKAELLEFAQQLGVSPANNDMTKDEIRAGDRRATRRLMAYATVAELALLLRLSSTDRSAVGGDATRPRRGGAGDRLGARLHRADPAPDPPPPARSSA